MIVKSPVDAWYESWSPSLWKVRPPTLKSLVVRVAPKLVNWSPVITRPLPGPLRLMSIWPSVGIVRLELPVSVKISPVVW